MSPRRYTDDQLRAAVATAKTMAEIVRALDLVPCGANYGNVRRRMGALGLECPLPARSTAAGLSTKSDDDVKKAVASSHSLGATLRSLGIPQGGGGYSALKARILVLGLDTSHFKGRGWSKGKKLGRRPRRSVAEILVDGSTFCTSNLKERLLSEGLLEARCAICGLSEWFGRPIPLEVDHINGRSDDHRLSNLRLVCPNCHAQTDTYRGRNIGSRSKPQQLRIL